MNSHALEALEFARLRDLLVTRAASAPGREELDRLAPLPDLDAARERIAAIGELHALQLAEPRWGAVAFDEIRPALARAAVVGSVLEAEELLAIARFLRTAARVAALCGTPEAATRHPRLADQARRVLVERAFPVRVDGTFEPSGAVRDAASPALKRVRRELHRLQHRVRERLARLTEGLSVPGEEAFVTLRGGRYVISVASAQRRRVAGVVHDRSASGKSVYLEPLEILEENNALAEREAEERAEVRRILAELTVWVRGQRAALEESLAALGRIDAWNAAARLARDLEASAPTLVPAGEGLRIVRGRHPLLFLAMGARTVPLALALDGEQRGLIVSGPNMGGKTVVLKTVGLIVAMAQSGLWVPAREGTVVPWIDELYVDIGDEQSLEADLSTYGARLRNMHAMLAAAGESSLVLIDELGAGTDPDEGAALGIALLQELAARRALCLVTTHHSAFKGFAAEQPGLENAAMEHDADSLAPTYRLHVGLPGRSHAFELARREGWPETVLRRARALLAPERVQSEELLEGIQAQRQELAADQVRLREERAAVAAEHRGLRARAEVLRTKIEHLQVEKALVADRRLRELDGLKRALRERLVLLAEVRGSAELVQERRWFHAQERRIAAIEKERPAPVAQRRGGGRALERSECVPGARAYARGLGVEVRVLEQGSPGRPVRVEHRGVRIAVPFEDLHLPDPQVPGTAPPEPGLRAMVNLQTEAQASVRGEVDLRGLTVDECLARLEIYLDRAFLAGFPQVRIIHGKGGGALRQAVARFLDAHPQVESAREGNRLEGGWGVTVALLKCAPSGEKRSRPVP